MVEGQALSVLRDRYTTALLSGNQEEAFSAIKDAMDRGINPLLIYVDVITPALAAIGNAWHQGELNIAAEHLAIQVTLQQCAYIRGLARRRQPVGAEAVITAVEGEMHAVGARLVADLFYLEGWDVAFLGENTPTADLVAWVQQRKPALVMLSLSQPDRIPVAKHAAAVLTSLENPPLVFVGGEGLSDPALQAEIPADLISGDPLEAIRVANRLLDVGPEKKSAADYLETLGRRVQKMRKERGWSQQTLAQKAGLDRAYLSTVEKGKQNITISAAVRIAAALDTSLSALISEDESGGI
jgi:methanogenic corrinoid protein MtbC1/DNA-binding XRE family transcriptional regulator